MASIEGDGLEVSLSLHNVHPDTVLTMMGRSDFKKSHPRGFSICANITIEHNNHLQYIKSGSTGLCNLRLPLLNKAITAVKCNHRDFGILACSDDLVHTRSLQAVSPQ